jgi:hypothetical protein
MNENLEFTEYFGTPIYVGELPELVNLLNNKTNSFIKKSKKENKNFIKIRNKQLHKDLKDFGISYNSSLLENISEFKDFEKYILNRSNEILDHMGYDLKKYILKFTKLEIREFGKGGNNEEYINENSHISGFYFLKCSDITPFPIFNDPRYSKVANQLPLKIVSAITYGSQMIGIHPKIGTLIMFPSFIQNKFSIDYGIDTFKFIYFNIQAIKNEL